MLAQSVPESKRCKSERQCPCQYVACHTGSIVSTMCSWYGSVLCLLQRCVKYTLILFMKLRSHSFWCYLFKSSEGEKMSACIDINMSVQHASSWRMWYQQQQRLKRKICYAAKQMCCLSTSAAYRYSCCLCSASKFSLWSANCACIPHKLFIQRKPKKKPNIPTSFHLLEEGVIEYNMLAAKHGWSEHKMPSLLALLVLDTHSDILVCLYTSKSLLC